MGNNYTPGPWEAIIEDEGIWVTPPNHDDPVICDIVARLGSFDENENYTQQYQDEDMANAYLIAAAPELLEACEKVRVKLLDNFGLFGGGQQLNEVFDILNNVIKKATGTDS